jgi:hypothetical protein
MSGRLEEEKVSLTRDIQRLGTELEDLKRQKRALEAAPGTRRYAWGIAVGFVVGFALSLIPAVMNGP